MVDLGWFEATRGNVVSVASGPARISASRIAMRGVAKLYVIMGF
jgi:hypothetical protein